jgi:hypothetical protein
MHCPTCDNRLEACHLMEPGKETLWRWYCEVCDDFTDLAVEEAVEKEAVE